MRTGWIGRIQERARREKVTYIRLADDPLAAEDKISKRRTLIAAKEKRPLSAAIAEPRVLLAGDQSESQFCFRFGW